MLWGILAGCYNPQRDLSIDPYNTPLIHILDASFNIEDSTTGVVVVQWEYLGQKRVENFVLQRRDNISGFRNIERTSGADAQGRYATVGGVPRLQTIRWRAPAIPRGCRT